MLKLKDYKFPTKYAFIITSTKILTLKIEEEKIKEK